MCKKFIILVSLLILIMIPISFAVDNETDLSSDATALVSIPDEGDVLKASNDYYFNASADIDGDGSQNNPYKYLTADRIKANCNIYLADGEYELDSSKTIEKVNIYGTNVERTVIQYSGVGFTVSSYLTIQNVTFCDMSITNYGILTANNTVFSYGYGSRYDSYGNNFGGAIYSHEDYSNARVTLNNCTFEHNFAIYGGAIYMGNGYLEVTDTIFNSNMAYNYGGAIACENAKRVIISKSKFYNSIAMDDAGGAIYLRATDFTGKNIEISNSIATFGSAITSLKSTVSLTGIVCENNTAKWDGGAIYHMYGNFSLIGSKFINNSARNGGVLYIDNSTSCYVISNIFTNNNASLTGGAVYSILNKLRNPFQVRNTFNNNHAYYMDDIFDTSSLNLEIGDGNYTMYKANPVEIDVLPSKYSLLDEGYVSSVKDQETGGNCWAFTAMAVVESCILKASGDSLDLSEENMKNLMAIYSDYGWNIDVNEGGYDYMQWGYLTSWLGPVLESDDLTDDKSALSPILKSILHIQNIMFLKRDNFTDNDAIKKAIMQYGAVGTGIAYYSAYINSNSYYCYSNMPCNHAVTIVGWDDNYSKSNFKWSGSIGDGAWIVKNSWGPSWGKDGYFYVSYYDVNFARPGDSEASYTIIFNDTIKYDKNYQYDISGETDYFINSSSSVWYKNVFKATDDEYLAAVSTYFEKVTNWTVCIYVNDEMILIKEGKSNPGYYTINLDQLIPLKLGDVFEVAFNINVDGEAGFPISENVRFNKLLYAPELSYLSYDGENWIDLYDLVWAYSTHTYKSQVACIKAFTVLNEIATDLQLNVSFEGTNPANITAIIHDQYGNHLKSGKVRFNVNEVDYYVNVVNGVAVLPFYFTNVYNNIYAMFEGKGYIESVSYTSFDLEKSRLGFDFNVMRTVNNVTLDIIASDRINSDAILTINEIEYPIEFVNGKYSLNLTNLKNGLYNIILRITFPQYSIYVDDTLNCSFIIDIKNTTIAADDLIITDEDDIAYNISLFDENGNAVSNRSIELTLDGKTYNATTDANGQAIILLKLNSGFYRANILFRGDNDYLNSDISTDIKVKCKVDIGLEVFRYANNVTLSINLSKPINDTLTVRINNKTEEIDVVNGFKALELFNLNNDIYNVYVGLDDSIYDFDEFSTSFIVDVKNTRIIANDVMSDEGDLNYTVILVDEFNSTLSNKSIEFILAGETYTAITDTDGRAIIPVKLVLGTYVSEIRFNGDEDYLKTVSSNTFTVKSGIDIDLTTQKDANNVLVMVKLSKRITGFLTLTVNNQSKILKVVNGIAKYQLSNLENGNYTVSVFLEGDYIFNEVSSTFSINFNKTQILANDLIMDDENPINYTVYLLDGEGNGIFNKSLEVVLNEIHYNFVTDENGQVIIPLDLQSGIYSLSIAFKGDDDYLRSANSTKITVKSQVNITLAIDKFADKVNLTFNLSKSINNTLTVLINNDTYEINVVGSSASLNLADLDNGVYDVGVDLDGSCYDFNHVDGQFIVDLKESAILIDNLTVNDDDLVDYNISLVDGDNNPIANRSLAFNLNGTIYNVRTDVNGQAVFTVKLNSGIYDVNVVFEGDDSYFKSSNVSSINVKTKVDIDLNIGKFANNVTLTVNLSKAINDTLTLKINNESYEINVCGSSVSLNLSDLDNGVYDVSVVLDSSCYDFNNVDGQFIVDVKKSLILIDNLTVNDDDLVDYNISLVDGDNNPIANRSLAFNLNGTIYNVRTDVNGQAVFTVKLNSGIYDVNVVFEGDDSYFKSSNVSSINVKTKVDIDLAIDKFANNVTLTVNFSKAINDTLTLKINNESYEINVIGSSTSLNLFDLNNGIYDVGVVLDSSRYDYNHVNDQFIVDVRNSVILMDDLVFNDGDLANYTVTLIDDEGNPIFNRSVMLIIGKDSYNLTTDFNGQAVFPLMLNPGSYEGSAVFNGDDSYFKSSNCSSILVKSKVFIDLAINKYANNVTLTVSLSKEINDTLTLRINNESYGIDVVGDIASLSLSNLANNIYNVEVSLSDSYYDYNKLSSQFVIDVKQTKIISYNLETVESSLCVFNATLLDEDDNPISNRSIELRLNGDNYTRITDEKGQISLTFNLTGGSYEIRSIFNGDNDYLKSDSLNRIKVRSIVSISVGYDNLLNDYIIWLNSSNPRNETLIVNVNNETYFVNVNDYANTIVLNNLSNGVYDVVISLKDSEDYYFEDIHSQFVINTVPSKIISDDLMAYHNIENTYSILLTDINGNDLANKLIVFTLNGNKTKAVTDGNGRASIDFKLPVGEYEIIVSYPGDYYEYCGCENSQSISVKSTIIENGSTTKTYNSIYSVKLLDGNGNPLVNTNVTCSIDDMEFVKATDSQGYLNIDILQKPGNYTLIVKNPVNDEILNKTINVVSRISQNKDLTMYEYGGNYYRVLVFDDDGNIAKAGEIVQMKIRGVIYKVKTASNGYVSLKINLKKNKYTVITRYKGYKVSNKILVKPVLITKNISVKKGKSIKFQAKLLNKKGKVLKGKKITFKFKGKKYTAKTNKKGIATIKIKLNLKVGSYKIYTSYSKSKATNTIKIKK